MQLIPSVTAAVLIVATTGSLSAQQPASAARQLPSRATATIQGEAINSISRVLADTPLRLRDARLGRIVTQSVTDKLGAFIFKGLDPGNYVVELVSQSQTIAATSLISANAGETVTAVVKIPFSPSLLGTVLKQEAATSALGTTSATGVIGPQSLTRIPALVPAGPPVTEQ